MNFSFFIAILISMAQIDGTNPVENSTLQIFQKDAIDSKIIPIAIYGDSVIAFGPNGGNGIEILSETYGDYYLLRADRQFQEFDIDEAIPHILFGDNHVIRATTSQISLISNKSWGLTRLTPDITKYENSLYSLPIAADTDPNIDAMISVITPQTSRQFLVNICSMPTRYSFTEYCRNAEQNIYNRFDSLGLDASFDTFNYSQTVMRNVIGQLTGTVHPESVIIVCAHLDCTSEIPATLAPGAEDNASGIAVLLEAARVFSSYATDYTIRFIAFTGEEQGLIGSDHYATAMQRQQQNIKAVINADMVGYSGPYAEDMHIFCDPNSYSLGALGASIIANYTQLDTIPHYEQAPRSGSDHYPFAIRNYPAIFFIDAWDDFDWYPYYHSVSDTIGNLNLDQQFQIARAVTALTATLAHPHFDEHFIPGDANGSGDVNGIDVVFLVNYLKGGPAPFPILSGDCNGDCHANGIDVVYLVNFLKGGSPPFGGDCR